MFRFFTTVSFLAYSMKTSSSSGPRCRKLLHMFFTSCSASGPSTAQIPLIVFHFLKFSVE
jgi:hypothetical protein